MFQWIKRQFAPKARPPITQPPRKARPPLREFVYLDEISLRSLLSSQIGEVTEGISQAVVDGSLNEAQGTAGANSPIFKAEMGARYQTTNSNTMQTSRKASVQSWFRELHARAGLRLIEPATGVTALPTVEALKSVQSTSVVIKASDMQRGALVEFKVRLKADPVFHLGTVVSEFAGMVEDHPDLMTSNLSLETFNEGLLVNKILQRLLVGLVPVRGEVIDYRSVEVDGVEYVAHVDALEGLDLDFRPLEIVGVTDQFAYWKDIRRVLFSDAEFTLLCRVSRTGLQSTWTPVKLADLFADLAPGVVEQLNEAGRAPFMPKPKAQASDPRELRLMAALELYVAAVVAHSGGTLTDDQKAQVNQRIYETGDRMGSATAQRSAFAAVAARLFEVADIRADPETDLELRERARIVSGLPLFPSLESKDSAALEPHLQIERSNTRLLDVEVVAIYW